MTTNQETYSGKTKRAILALCRGNKRLRNLVISEISEKEFSKTHKYHVRRLRKQEEVRVSTLLFRHGPKKREIRISTLPVTLKTEIISVSSK